MSKTNSIDKRRFHSFLIYIVILCLFYGCAAKTSVDMSAKEAESQSQIEDEKVNQLASKAVIEEPLDIKSSVQTGEGISERSEIIPKEKEYTEAEPRIFVKPTSTKSGQVLGIDFSMLPKGKSRLTVTCNKEVSYDLDRNKNTLSLNIHDSSIGELLYKEIDTTEFQTALKRIKPVFDKKNNLVTLEITMREIVPYHIKHAENRITMDFGRIKSKIAEKKIVPLNLVEGETKTLAAVQKDKKPATINEKKYTGAIIGTLEFANEDVANILRLINEITKVNIVWDPVIKGKKVSMILKDTPWDEALELTLMLTDLAKRYVGPNTILVTTNQKMTKMLNDEDSAANKKLQKIEQEQKKKEEKNKKAVDEAPLKTEYLPVDFAEVAKIQELIKPSLSERGDIRIDERTSTIIIIDTAQVIEAAKATVKRFDTPVKQIRIEARIVDMSSNFSRDLGIQWQSLDGNSAGFQRGWQKNEGTAWGTDSTQFGTDGDLVVGGSFSTNAPEDWGANIGLSLARLTNRGLGTVALDMALALAETEGTAKVMSSPSIMTTVGSSATISRGDSLVLRATENVASTTLDATLSLEVTSIYVSPNNYITMEVIVTDDRAPSSDRILKKSIQTTLTIKSGEFAAIGGIVQEDESDSESGIPVLRDIPGLGWLFKAKSKISSKSELVIFIQPTVVPFPEKNDF